MTLLHVFHVNGLYVDSKEWQRFPVKLTDPLTSILYITADKIHVEELKHAIHVKAIEEGKAASVACCSSGTLAHGQPQHSAPTQSVWMGQFQFI